eukprot:s898_g8.t1
MAKSHGDSWAGYELLLFEISQWTVKQMGLKDAETRECGCTFTLAFAWALARVHVPMYTQVPHARVDEDGFIPVGLTVHVERNLGAAIVLATARKLLLRQEDFLDIAASALESVLWPSVWAAPGEVAFRPYIETDWQLQRIGVSPVVSETWSRTSDTSGPGFAEGVPMQIKKIVAQSAGRLKEEVQRVLHWPERLGSARGQGDPVCQHNLLAMFVTWNKGFHTFIARSNARGQRLVIPVPVTKTCASVPFCGLIGFHCVPMADFDPTDYDGQNADDPLNEGEDELGKGPQDIVQLKDAVLFVIDCSTPNALKPLKVGGRCLVADNFLFH